MKRYIVVLIILVAVAGFYLMVKRSRQLTSSITNPDITLYWGNGCSHCEKVKQFIVDNNLDQRLKIQLKEVYYNRNNQLDLNATAQKCPEINTAQRIGVPLAYLVSENRCLSGDTPIIGYLQEKFGIK